MVSARAHSWGPAISPPASPAAGAITICRAYRARIVPTMKGTAPSRARKPALKNDMKSRITSSPSRGRPLFRGSSVPSRGALQSSEKNPIVPLRSSVYHSVYVLLYRIGPCSSMGPRLRRGMSI